MQSQPKPSQAAVPQESNSTPRPRKWTYLELAGLMASLFLLMWPVINLITGVVFPGSSNAAGVGIVKTVDKTQASVGKTLNYQITVINGTGGDDILSITDNLPLGLTVSSVTVDPISACKLTLTNNGGQYSVNCQSSTLFAKNATAILYIGATVNNKASAGSSLSNQATASIGVFSATSNSVSTAITGTPFTPTFVPATTGPVPTVVPSLSPLPTYPTVTPNKGPTTVPTSVSTTAPATTAPVTTSTASTTTANSTVPPTTVATTAPTTSRTTIAAPTAVPTNRPTVVAPTATNVPPTTVRTTVVNTPTPAPIAQSLGNSTISGQVTVNGNPASGFTLRLNGGNYQNSGSNGNYSFNKLTAGTYSISILVDTNLYVSANAVYEKKVSISDNQTLSDINFDLKSTALAPTNTTVSTTTSVPTSTVPAETTNVAATTTSAPTPISVATSSGVVAGSFTAGGVGLATGQISLVLRGGGVDTVAATTNLDSSGKYFFSSVPATAPNHFYFVSYANSDPNSGILALWNSNPFGLNSGGTVNLPSVDVADVNLGVPGSTDLSIELPYTFKWTVRNSNDQYSLSFFLSDGSKGGSDTGSIGNVSSFTVSSGSLAAGDYFGRINLVNSSGTGSSNHLYHFQVKPTTKATAPVTTVITTSPATTIASTTVNVVTKATTTNVPTQTKANDLNVENPTATPKAAQEAPRVPATSTLAISGGQGSRNTSPTTVVAASNPSSLPNGTNSNVNTSNDLPTTGGELPIAGLILAFLTLLERRTRLFFQLRRLRV